MGLYHIESKADGVTITHYRVSVFAFGICFTFGGIFTFYMTWFKPDDLTLVDQAFLSLLAAGVFIGGVFCLLQPIKCVALFKQDHKTADITLTGITGKKSSTHEYTNLELTNFVEDHDGVWYTPLLNTKDGSNVKIGFGSSDIKESGFIAGELRSKLNAVRK